jgi:Thioredoxin like C-terminal domain
VGGQPTELNEPGGRIAHRFHARDVNLVMGAREGAGSARFRVRIDGERPGGANGLDVDDEGNGKVAEERLYQLVRQPGNDSDRTFEITFLDSGVQAYVFTFG